MKKLLIMFAVITAIFAVSVIGANAAAGICTDFSEPPLDGKVSNYSNWNPYSASAYGNVTWEDEMIRLERPVGGGSLIWDIGTGLSNPVNFTMFDAKFNEIAAACGISGYYFNGVSRAIPDGVKGFEPNVWYKIMFVSTQGSDGNYYLSVFVKKEGEDTWTSKLSGKKMDASSEGAKVRINWSSSKNDDVGAVMYMDNFEAHDGLYWEALSLTDNNGTEILAGDAIAEDATELTLDAVIYDAKHLKSDMMTNPESMMTTPILVVYDKDGMMLDCAISEHELVYFENNFSVTAELSYYDRAEIDSVKLYFWDSMDGMLNIMEPVELLKATN